MSVRLAFAVILTTFVCTTRVQAEFPSSPTNPIEYVLRTNGWGWSDGYHANNHCRKTGVLPRSYAPVYQGYANYGNSAWAAQSYQASAPSQSYHYPAPSQTPAYYQPQPTLAPRPAMENLPPARPQMAPQPAPQMMQKPANTGFPFGPAFSQPQVNDRAAFRPMPLRP